MKVGDGGTMETGLELVTEVDSASWIAVRNISFPSRLPTPASEEGTITAIFSCEKHRKAYSENLQWKGGRIDATNALVDGAISKI